MKKYQIKLQIWLIIGMLLGPVLSQSTMIRATTLTRQESNTEKVQDKNRQTEKERLEQFLKQNNLIQDKNGKLYTTTASNYTHFLINDHLNFIPNLLDENNSVYVDPNAHVANIDIHFSNGYREFGWYGKRVNGEIALCIEPGVALNVGPNGGYTRVAANTELMKQISLIKYYGIMAQSHTLSREIMTQILVYEQLEIMPISISGIFSMADYQVFKANVMTQINKFYTIPSFNGQTVTLKVGESITLTDSNRSFSNYRTVPELNSVGINVEKAGDSVILTATSDAKDSGIIRFMYDIPASYEGVPILYQHPYTQNVLIGRMSDSVSITINVNVLKNGNARIRKVDKTTKQPLAGAVFRFTTSDGQSKELTTDSDGYATWNDLLVDTKVTIEEIKAPDGYILNAKPQTITIKANETTTVSLDNQEQLANLTLIKEDEETGTQPQGAASLIGAIYELTDVNGKSVAKLTLEEMEGVAKAEIKGLKLGTYFLQEIEPPEGYILDPTKYTVNLTYAGQNETVALHSKMVTDRVIKGHVEGYKFGSRPLIPHTVFEIMEAKSQASKPPLAGVELTATSHTTGQKYVEVTKENGYFKFEDLPYDTYTIEETQGVEGYLLFEPFEVTITEDGYTHFYLLEDRIIESRLHLIKVDEETGENIPYAGAKFKIFDTWANEGEGAFVSMQRPNDIESTDIFATNEKGEIVTTESLAWGVDRYELHEIQAPEGYVPLEKPLVFSVTAEDNGALIRLEVPNRLARQNIELIKRDRLNEQSLAKVPFQLYQVEKGETGEAIEKLVEVYFTDQEGKIEIEGLPYGEYKFVEKEPLAGYLPLEKPLDFSVTVENDGERIVLEAYNEREKLELTSLFTDLKGEKTMDPTIENRLRDMVWVKGKAIEIGHTYTVFTQYKNTKTGKVVSEAISTYTAKNKEDEFEIFLDLPANTLKDGDQLTATHVLYYEAEQKNEVAREDDLTNKEQTVTFKAPVTKQTFSMLPKTGEWNVNVDILISYLLVVLSILVWFRKERNKWIKSKKRN